MITPSQRVFTYCCYNEKKVWLDRSRRHTTVSSRDSTVYYWMSLEGYTEKDTIFLPESAVVTEQLHRDNNGGFFFPARVKAAVIKESKVVGYYDKSKFPPDFDGPLFGVGQGWCNEDIHDHVRQTPIKNSKVYVPYDGKIYEVYKFQFLCAQKFPKLSHITYPTINWVTVSDGHLPPNTIAAGVAPNGEVLYVGRGKVLYYEGTKYLMIPGYIVPSENCLHICFGSGEHCCSSEYEVLTVENQDGFEWGESSHGKVPPNCVTAYKRDDSLHISIGRTVTGSDISTAATCMWQRGLFDLPHGIVTDTHRLLGKIDRNNSYQVDYWGDIESIIYPSYEILKFKITPKSLKDLCFNAIITSTMGISDRIDQLPLPMIMRNVLKEICQLQ